MSAIYILISIPGLLLHVFVAVPSVVDHQLTCTKCCQKCEKKLMSTSITTAYHILDEEKPNWSDTSWFWRPPWSSPPGCPCHPQCRWPPTFMSLMLSNMLKIYNHYHPSISHLSWRKFLLGAVHILRNTKWGGGLPDLLQYYIGGGLPNLLQYYIGGLFKVHYNITDLLGIWKGLEIDHFQYYICFYVEPKVHILS